jgi:hypothetical protein
MACDYPSQENVRQGVVYAFGTMTGTLGVGTISPPTVGSSPFAAIAAAVKARLVLALGIDPAFVRVVANDRYKLSTTETFFVYLQIFGVTQPKDPALDYTDAGAGRLATPTARRMRVYIYTRSGQDQYGDDYVAMFGTDPTLTVDDDAVNPGQLLAEELTFNALSNFLPQASDGTPLTLGPLHPLDASEEPQRKDNDAGFLRSCLDFEAVYISPISPTDPALS